MSEQSRLVISARLDEVRHACDFVVEAAEIAGLDERAVYHCQMAVDETITNIIEHGYQYNGDNHDIEVYCYPQDDLFVITIADDSPAFNPLDHDAPDPAAPLANREPGGWGIYFIRRLMDDVSYERHADRNRLTLIKRRPHPTSDAPASPDVDETFPIRALENKRAIIAPTGRLDSNNSPRLEKALDGQLRQGIICLFVDMAGVDYIASSALKVLVSAWRRARDHDGDVVLVALQPRIIEIFEMVGFDMLFQVFPTLDDALDACPG